MHAEFGDGLWGEAQHRIELGGMGVGGSFGDRYELGVTTYFATQETGIPDPSGVRAKIRLADFADGAASIGVHVSRIRATVDNGVQHEQATAFDIAVPVTYFPISDATGGANHVFGMYVAPRLVFESFADRESGEVARGTVVSAVLGSTGRWRYVAATGELIAARTPSFGLAPFGVRVGFIVLPLLRASLIFPL